MSPAKHSAICAQIQQLHQAKESKLLARIEKLEAQRTWVGLTDGEFVEACQMAERGNYLVAFQRIQAKLKQKNGCAEEKKT